MVSGFSMGTPATSPVLMPTFTMLCPLRTRRLAARLAYRPWLGVAPKTNVILFVVFCDSIFYDFTHFVLWITPIAVNDYSSGVYFSLVFMI
jgi:hypothetical protein